MENKVNPEPFKWKEEYNVNITIIDEQHKKFLEIINELKIIINGNLCKKRFLRCFFN